MSKTRGRKTNKRIPDRSPTAECVRPPAQKFSYKWAGDRTRTRTEADKRTGRSRAAEDGSCGVVQLPKRKV